MIIKKILLRVIFIGLWVNVQATKPEHLVNRSAKALLNKKQKKIRRENGCFLTDKFLFDRYRLVVEFYYSTVKKINDLSCQLTDFEMQQINSYFEDCDKISAFVHQDNFINMLALMVVISRILQYKKFSVLAFFEIPTLLGISTATLTIQIKNVKASQMASIMLENYAEILSREDKVLLHSIVTETFRKDLLPFIFDQDSQDPLRGIPYLNYLMGIQDEDVDIKIDSLVIADIQKEELEKDEPKLIFTKSKIPASEMSAHLTLKGLSNISQKYTSKEIPSIKLKPVSSSTSAGQKSLKEQPASWTSALTFGLWK